MSDPQAKPSDRLTAVDLAGDYTVVNDELAALLLGIVGNPAETDEMRAMAAISLGPAIESADEALDWEDDDVPITEGMFRKIQAKLEEVYRDQSAPKPVRRRVLEASVRASADWHKDAIQSAYVSGDRDWVLTAVFAMRHHDGFDRQILESLDSPDPEIQYEAVAAAGEHEIDKAWPKIVKLLKDPNTPKNILLAAIEAVGLIRPDDAWRVLEPLESSEDTEIAEAVQDSLSLVAEVDGEEDFLSGGAKKDEEE